MMFGLSPAVRSPDGGSPACTRTPLCNVLCATDPLFHCKAPSVSCGARTRRELGELLSDRMEDAFGAHEAWGTGERHIKHLRSRPTYRVRAGMRRAPTRRKAQYSPGTDEERMP